MVNSSRYGRVTWPIFLELISLPQKTTALMPLLFGFVYAQYAFGRIDWVNTLIYFVAQFCVALFVSGFNHVQDFKKAKDPAYLRATNIISREHLNPRKVLELMFAILSLACVLGLILVFRTNLILFLIGGAAILVAIFYTAGPIPLSRLPLGEVLSGPVEGCGTIFIASFINMRELPMGIYFHSGWVIDLVINLPLMIQLILVGLPFAIMDSTVMFADNICDLTQDIHNERFTLPFYLGKKRAVQIYPLWPLAALLFLVISVWIGYLPVWSLLTILLLPWIIKNVRIFMRRQDKQTTFHTAISNLLIIDGAQVLIMVIYLFAA
ncbi:UbiA family prenyltransferase [Oenococcus kitaharae]|uniref:Putative prenyltransferase protein n=1 Tax=Oenococcus kitaharae DSM 17330 TaxID=1045004 RepID=G9WIL6_9LACO|nr:UbiA family prenyltransferase [Oenococcus kitaharae]EHN58155.1 Putative prenyltransferase protein [Oenococcus kitaharae DSM 17330]OEY81640.1 1,4-dihydroxy-2-naphthoate prenyltransferase [Oenococcus kitaharae]OEY83125.1 1,4-dihydroxy-2-naphthoate prenyltransferase [Oenococcus kitaharae]OEY84329.1 1,4-dihydroxy-2-naphthoate prenyltransferase [Oenococcus kitaharae]